VAGRRQHDRRRDPRTNAVQPPPFRFEAGTGSIADAVALRTAIEYVESLGLDAIAAHEHELLEYGTKELRRVPGLRLIGTATTKAAIWSFVLDGHHTHDVAAALDAAGIAVRAGHHCARPTLRRFGLDATVRPPAVLYNTHQDLAPRSTCCSASKAARSRRPPSGGRYYIDSTASAGGGYQVDPYRC
jgi:selenocysteine lyase/cysteine desulfurase